MTPAATRRSQTAWAAPAGVAMTPMAIRSVGDHALQLVEPADPQAAHVVADPARVAVEQRDDPEAPRGEAGVVGERLAEVADADDDDGEVLGDADLAGDLVAEVLHVVADSPGAVGAEVGQVLAQLGAVDAGRGRQLLARAARTPTLGQRRRGPGGRREPGHGRLRDAPRRTVGSPSPRVAASPAPGRPAWRVLDSRCSWLVVRPTVRRLGRPWQRCAAGLPPTLGVCERQAQIPLVGRYHSVTRLTSRG